MEKSLTGETASSVLDQAKAANFTVNRDQLNRWHLEGLIPRPEQCWTEGVPGSETIYPLGTGDQLVALCRIRQELRKSKDIGWRLWWLGFDVNQELWKERLQAEAQSFNKTAPCLVKLIQSDEIENSGFSFASIIKNLRVRNMVFRQLRKRVGEKGFDFFMGFMADILSGEFTGWTGSFDQADTDNQLETIIMDKALGFAEARKKLPPNNQPWLDSDIEKAFDLLASRLGEVCLSEVLKSCSDKQILQTRNELRALLHLAIRASASPDPKHRNNRFGLKMLASFERMAGPRVHRTIILFLLALKEDSVFENNLEIFLASLRNNWLSDVTHTQLEAYKLVDPAIIEFLNPLELKV